MIPASPTIVTAAACHTSGRRLRIHLGRRGIEAGGRQIRGLEASRSVGPAKAKQTSLRPWWSVDGRWAARRWGYFCTAQPEVGSNHYRGQVSFRSQRAGCGAKGSGGGASSGGASAASTHRQAHPHRGPRRGIRAASSKTRVSARELDRGQALKPTAFGVVTASKRSAGRYALPCPRLLQHRWHAPSAAALGGSTFVAERPLKYGVPRCPEPGLDSTDLRRKRLPYKARELGIAKTSVAVSPRGEVPPLGGVHLTRNLSRVASHGSVIDRRSAAGPEREKKISLR